MLGKKIMPQNPENAIPCYIRIIDSLCNLSIWNWIIIVLCLSFIGHFSLHKKDASLSPKKICKCISFVVLVFITTLICNLFMKNIMAYRDVKLSTDFSDISGFYNNIITYLSLAFAIISMVAYNSIKVLTEEKARMMVEKEINSKIAEAYKKLLEKYKKLELETNNLISSIEPNIDDKIEENFGKKYGEKIANLENLAVQLEQLKNISATDTDCIDFSNEKLDLPSTSVNMPEKKNKE